MRLRKLPDGKLLAPRRGQPPVVPDGYERDPGDPFVFLPALSDCDHRITEIKSDGCCTKVMRICDVINKIVGRHTCVECQGDIKWIQSSSVITPEEQATKKK